MTLFPEMFPGPLQHSLPGKALEDKKWKLNVMNIRDFATDTHKTVDDTPFGGGAGMILKADVMGKAIDSILEKNKSQKLIYFSPRGIPLHQEKVKSLSQEDETTLICGRYEGVDERLLEVYDIEEISVGDYILSGGELPGLILIDSVVRLLPNVIGKKESYEDESFENGLLEYPQYTKPRCWEGKEVPEVLLTGDHGKIKKWKKENLRK